MNYLFDGDHSGSSVAHLVVRGTYMPNTARCTADTELRPPPFISYNSADLEGISKLTCYADVRVNQYIVGSGPSNLTTVVFSIVLPLGPSPSPDFAERVRRTAELALVLGGESRMLSVSEGGIDGREKMMFIGVASNYAIEAFEVYDSWDVVRRDDGTVMVHHPWRDYWLGEDATKYRSKVEWTLHAFDKETNREHNARMEKYDGRVAMGAQYPRVIADASNLHQVYVDTGAVNEPAGPPRTDLPPACGLAVPDYRHDLGLVLDCTVLLGLKDTLRGTGTLNWGMDTPITEWDGVKVVDGRVASLVLNNKELTGTVPAELAQLTWWLLELRLSGNSLTGCISPALRNVATNDLDDLRLPDCAAP